MQRNKQVNDYSNHDIFNIPLLRCATKIELQYIIERAQLESIINSIIIYNTEYHNI